MSNTEIVRQAIFTGYKVGETFTAPGIALLLANKLTGTQVGVSLASIEKDSLLPCIEKSGFMPQENGRSLRLWKHLPKPATKAHPIPPKPTEPELDYAQIGKSIIERIKQLDTLANEGIEERGAAKTFRKQCRELVEKVDKQAITIRSLNDTITDLNEQLRIAKLDKPRVTDSGKTFKLGDIARITG